MRLDIFTIFVDYFAPLELSLAGRAQANGLVDVRVQDLRNFTHDRHRSVDDAPYGGGAGMVMKPEPWGEALDSVIASQSTLIIPTPSGDLFTQQDAERLARRQHLVFACGRYEGIDDRVARHFEARCEVVEVSLGDFVLNGGEIAAMAMIEAIVRLLPGFMSNPESLAEESHGNDGLLEYPVYTRPDRWREIDVPDVLLSGDHERVQQWRNAQAIQRTQQRRPELLAAPATGD